MKKILVKFTLSYLRFFAKLQIKKINPIIVGIGGSSGKSSLCAIIAILLSEKYTVKQSKGKNSESGIPLDILGITMNSYGTVNWLRTLLLAPITLLTNFEKYDVYVVEMGIDSPVEPKNMRYLLKIIQPYIGVLTNISLEHSQYFDQYIAEENEKKRRQKILEMTTEQETLLLTSLPRDGTAIINADDEWITQLNNQIQAQQICISTNNHPADLRSMKISSTLDTFSVRFTGNNKTYTLTLPALLPHHYASSFLLAIAVGKALKVPVEESIELLKKTFALPPGRSSIFQGIKQTTIIDSSYNNATLPPILDMLALLKIVGGHRRKIAIIGDMRELGSMSQLNHEIVARRVLNTADIAILIGPLMNKYAAPILQRHKFLYQTYQTFSEAKKKILETIKSQDIILVKSSQNTLYLERVVELLLADKHDVAKLCRRGPFWDEQRRNTK